MELIDGPSLDYVLRQLRQASRTASGPSESGRGSAGSPRGAEAVLPASPDATGPYIPQAESPSELPSPLSSSSLGSGSPYFDAVARMMAEVADALGYLPPNG